MGAPWSRTYPDLVCEDGEATWFVLGVPSRGVLQGLKVSQEDGTAEGFGIDLFTSAAIMDGDSTVGDEELFKVFATKSVAGPNVLLTDYANRYPYQNQDGSPCLRENKLYLRITPTGGSPTKTYNVSLTVELPTIC